MTFTRPIAVLLASVVTLGGLPAFADGELNIYSSRHYDTDERLYSDFEEATGITINRIEGNADELIARMEAEGANSPADILLTVDASRTYRADQKGLYQPIESEVLNRRIPDYLRHPEGHWFGFSQRARIIFYAKDRVEEPPRTYADLADPRYEGLICTRSATNVYSQTLLAAIITHEGRDAAKAWAEGLKNNLARDPQGGDTDQLRGLVSGECDIAVANTYYFARAIRTEVDGVTSGLDNIGWIFPDQSGYGAHVNVSTGGVAAHAPNRDNAVKFLEYLASDQAQEYFSNGNDEYPGVSGVALAPSVAALGYFRSDTVGLGEVAENTPEAQQVYNEIGFE
ncbi:extracellular solute-binding protein [Oceanibium sediminis]|uniref:extracellular solute-binding protein n=1 Tax=Oceanibium sediminis TaxID=2026339 RepID=UPI000DD2E36A|nr:extracellular solute-binding protein [Oceanibium sediminis]